jgi:DNA-binding response OmpR family regulator
MNMPKKIVIVEDEVITQRFLQDIFSQYDTAVVGCFDNAGDLLANIKGLACDMILMDINIKGPVDGIQLARKILEKHDLPIVFITAHNDDETLEETLELSPYGFICKPFTSKDVVVTLQIAYKRYLAHTKALDAQSITTAINSEDITISEKYRYAKNTAQLYRDGTPINLTKNQSALIEILVQNLDQTVSYEVLVSFIWGEGHISDSALRTLVYSLRKLLPDLPIVSHSKAGYALESFMYPNEA